MNDSSRRAFVSRLLSGVGGAVAWGALPHFTAAHEHAASQVKTGEHKFTYFTSAEATQMEAVCAQTLPADDGPGAREDGAIYFIDYALSQTEPHLQPLFRDGLRPLAEASAPQSFNELKTEQQFAVLRKLESTEFFQRAREYT